MKKGMTTLLLLFTFVLGMCILMYPMISDYWNSLVQSAVIVDYDAALAQMTPTDYSQYFEEADKYNAAIRQLDFPLMYFYTLDEREDLKKYEDQLNVGAGSVLGYITIEKIGVELPMYHGTGEAVLAVGVGHVEGTSLPVGGESTHCVLSAHRGLPSAKLFSDLDQLKVGDTFTMTVLDRLMTYEVDQILIVKPNQVESLYVTPGMDYCTLVTCTPYGINSHRLLVRGHRIENAVEKPKIYVPADAVKIDGLLIAPLVAMPMLLALLVFLMIKYRKKS